MIPSASSGATGLRRSRAGAAGCHAGRALALRFRFAPRATAARGSRRPTPRARASARASARGGRGRGGPRAAAPARPFQRRCAIRSQRQAARLFTTVRVPHGCGGCRGSLLGRLGSVQFGPQEHFHFRLARFRLRVRTADKNRLVSYRPLARFDSVFTRRPHVSKVEYWASGQRLSWTRALRQG